MPDERVSDVLRVCQEALGREGAARAAYLDAACGSDPVLRREVEALLAESSASGSGFLETPPWAPAPPALAVGQRLGPYEVTGRLGAGGMGEVYRARDTQLKRDVALKVLPAAVAADPGRLARFQREAQLLAVLNHPQIAQIHGLAEADDVRALVMELVEGPTLGERIAGRPVPVDEALPIALQLAEALEYAHGCGIIHRDLKPANIKITTDGTVKVLDFGLAKTLEGDVPTRDPSQSPAVILPTVTRSGVIVGTAAYMSPEQARGAAVDKRADIWAFGVVLFELLSGRRPFQGETASDTLAAVLRGDVDWSALPADTPPSVRHLVHRCLVRQPKERLHDIGDARLEIEEAISGAGTGASSVAPAAGFPPPTRLRVSRAVPWGLAAVATLVAAAAWVWRPTRAPIATALDLPVRFGVTVPPGDELGDSSYRTLAISPDGRDIVFAVDRAGDRFLLRRPLASLDAVPVAGSEGGATMPFLSPDGGSIGFLLPGVGIATVPVAGGPVRLRCEAYTTGDAAWANDGGIIVGGLRGLARCSPGSTRPESLTSIEPQGEVFGHQEPQVLPDGRVLFVIEHASLTEEKRQIALLDTARKVRVLMRGVTSPRYAPPGDLLFVRGDVLYSVPVDPVTLVPRGRERRLTAGIGAGEAYHSAYYRHARYDVSRRGPLVYQPDQLVAESELAWVEPSGMVRPLPVRRQDYRAVALSPDGRSLAAGIEAGAGREVWVFDLGRDAWVRVSYGAAHGDPTWTRDGRRLVFASNRGGPWTIYTAAADGSGTPLPVGMAGLYAAGTEASELPGGRGLVFSASDELGFGLFVRRAGEPGATRISPPRVPETRPAVSPDGRWLAYLGRDTGGLQLYVRDMPGLATRLRISTEGASRARWAADSRTLYYQAGGRIMAASIPLQAAPTASAGNPDREAGRVASLDVSRPRIAAEVPGLVYFDVAPDGRLLVIRRMSMRPPPQLVVVLNWRSLLDEGGAAGAEDAAHR